MSSLNDTITTEHNIYEAEKQRLDTLAGCKASGRCQADFFMPAPGGAPGAVAAGLTPRPDKRPRSFEDDTTGFKD